MQRIEKTTVKNYSHEQLEGEPDKHYAVFEEYLSMGQGRRVNKLSPHHRYSLHNIYHLCRKYHWSERILSYESSVGKEIRKEKERSFKTTLSKYEENALLTFEKIQDRYGEFISNISNFWPNEVESKELKKFIQQKNREKKQSGNFQDIMPLYADPSADKNNITKQLSHIEKVLTIIGKFQIICDKFIIKLERGDFREQNPSSDLFLEDLEELGIWIESSTPCIIKESRERIEEEFYKNENKVLDFGQVKY